MVALCAAVAGCATREPRVWYCLAYNAPNHRQYQIGETGDRGWSRVYTSLAPHVRWQVDAEVPTAERLSGVDLVVILNPEEGPWEGGPPPRQMTDADIGALADYVRGGGALLFGSNQDQAHNIEKQQSNRLLARFGVRVARGDIGLKVLDIAQDAPVVGGLRWRFFIGSPVELLDGGEWTTQVLAWNDPAAPTLEGEPGQRVPLMVASEVGSGRVIVVGDSGWTANGTIGLDDNWRILWRQIRWLARGGVPEKPPPLQPWSPPEVR